MHGICTRRVAPAQGQGAWLPAACGPCGPAGLRGMITAGPGAAVAAVCRFLFSPFLQVFPGPCSAEERTAEVWACTGDPGLSETNGDDDDDRCIPQSICRGAAAATVHLYFSVQQRRRVVFLLYIEIADRLDPASYLYRKYRSTAAQRSSSTHRLIDPSTDHRPIELLAQKETSSPDRSPRIPNRDLAHPTVATQPTTTQATSHHRSATHHEHGRHSTHHTYSCSSPRA
jgi:hypothetical protein